MAGVRADRDAAVIVGARSGRSRGVAALRPYHAPARGRCAASPLPYSRGNVRNQRPTSSAR